MRLRLILCCHWILYAVSPALADVKSLRVTDETGAIVIASNSDWDEIVIPANTVLKARIHVLEGRTNDVTIRGENRYTSVLAPNGWFGLSNPKAKHKEGKMLGNIYSDCDCTVSLSTFTSRNSQKFHILGDTDKSVILADNLSIHTRVGAEHSGRNYATTDGFGGGVDSRIRNSEIDTFDDSIKIYREMMTAENVTIFHNKNGAPFQFGWGGFDYAKLVAKGQNRVFDQYKYARDEDYYHHGVFGWVSTHKKGLTREIVFLGPFRHDVLPNRNKSYLYTFGKNGKNKSGLKDVELKIWGAHCAKSTAENTELRHNSAVAIIQDQACLAGSSR